MLAYIDDFWMMFLVTLAVIPLLLLIRPPKAPPDPSAAHAAME